mmetsp:Transcript_10182/g.11430  ORF Transcript_10182/g.11430 Transcript_10182/m.11430 type:complete len:272 (+) Transcript_10182:84-899(+)
MKLLLIPSLYNNALIAVTTFLVVVVLPPQESFAFRHDLGSSSASSSASSDTYHIPLNDGDVVVRTLQFRGGSKIDIIKPIDNDNDDDDGDGDPITNIAGIQIDDSFRGGGQYQRQHYSTATTLRTGGFVKQPNNLARKLRRLHDMRCTVNKAWSQVTKGYSLLCVPRSNQNPRNTDALLAVQVRGGADKEKKNQNHKVVNDSTTDVVKKDRWMYSLLAVALGLCIAFSPDVSQDQYVGWYTLLAVALGVCLAGSPFGNSRLANVLVAATGG